MVMKSIKCHQCGRMLGKLDDDGTFHVRIGKDGPQIFVKVNDVMDSNLMLVCPAYVYTPQGKIKCGSQHVLNSELLSAC